LNELILIKIKTVVVFILFWFILFYFWFILFYFRFIGVILVYFIFGLLGLFWFILFLVHCI